MKSSISTPSQVCKYSMDKTNQEPQERKSIFNLFDFIYIFMFSSIIQFVSFVYKRKINLDYVVQPLTNEQPMSSIYNLIFSGLPNIYLNKLYKDIDLKNIFHLSTLSTLIFYYLKDEGFKFVSFIISSLILFDETIIALSIKNPSSILQLILIMMYLIQIKKLTSYSFLNPKRILNTSISWTFAVLSFSLRVESFPILVLLFFNIFNGFNDEESKKSYIAKLFRFLGVVLMLIIFTIICSFLLFSVFFIFGTPKWAIMSNDIKLYILELLVHPHNLSIVLPLVISLILNFTSCWTYYLIIFLILIQPITCVLNDLLIKISISKLFILISYGISIKEYKESVISKILTIIISLIYIHLFINPIQSVNNNI